MRLVFVSLALATMLLARPLAATAQTPNFEDTPVRAPLRKPLEEVLVTAEHDTRVFEPAETLDMAPDSAELLRNAPGANVVSNGPLTGMAYYRGMSRFRISSRINGAFISPGGPNWMDPPLSYAPAAHLDTLEIYRGIAPVSAGQETIGGVVNATTWSGSFADQGAELHGRMRTGAQSVNDSTLLSGAFVLSDRAQRLKLSGLSERADDASFGGGDIVPTEYRRDRFDIGYGFRQGVHTLQLDFGRNETGHTGTPALPMDIAYIDSNLYGLAYEFDGERWQVDARLYYSQIDHGMSNYHLRPSPGEVRNYRRNTTDGRNAGFTFSANRNGWALGMDVHDERHNGEIDNPQVPQFFVDAFNDAERRVVGLFVQRQLALAENWSAELGLRYNRVTTDAGRVDATPARLGIPPAVQLRDSFNTADRSVADNNVDGVAKIYFAPRSGLQYFAGVSRKTRSPAYQERYLWLPLQATAGLADGLTYTGRIDLDAEVAREVELGLDWETSTLSLSPRVFYRDVKDYIQGTPSTNVDAVTFVRMMNMMNGASMADPLELNNVDATFYGFDVDWRYTMNARWSLSGAVNYVRGKREDIDDDLYRIAPLNGRLAVDYRDENWGLSLESLLYARQNRVSATNAERTSDSYEVFSFRGFWQLTRELRLSSGVDNLLDKRYEDHLAGVNRVTGNPDIAPGQRLPGYGRSVFARLDYQW